MCGAAGGGCDVDGSFGAGVGVDTSVDGGAVVVMGDDVIDGPDFLRLFMNSLKRFFSSVVIENFVMAG